ncbi:hypothetical protein N7447_002408 [Penicillium robsamsonii]|uniref:uncharacterized protein n=1 Tax=Penicillium robsamsonii TaxID=1792511 RepID=UPI002548CB6A|nr:uncharacterized protein N7447_002408 [Penicillium robsamsonii]KAJ5836382.1 hypothetical protein N7447_002408 [Penicillium robsamsonii]
MTPQASPCYSTRKLISAQTTDQPTGTMGQDQGANINRLDFLRHFETLNAALSLAAPSSTFFTIEIR